MNLNPLVSIVLPTYNGSRYLGYAIQSCIDQSYSDWELIIVDDASTDQTPAIIEKYLERDKRISSIRHKVNRKLPAALNSGFSRTKGEFLTWVSDDNCYRTNAFEEMVAFLQHARGVDIVYTDFTEIDESGNPLRYVAVKEPEALPFFNPIGGCFLYRRIVHERLGGYDENLFLVEDYDFWLRASIFFKLCPLHKDLYLIQIHPDSLTNLGREQVQRLGVQVVLKNLPHMKWINNNKRAQGFLHQANIAYRCRDLSMARRGLLYALRYSPALIVKQISHRWVAQCLFGQRFTNSFRSLMQGFKRSFTVKHFQDDV